MPDGSKYNEEDALAKSYNPHYQRIIIKLQSDINKKDVLLREKSSRENQTEILFRYNVMKRDKKLMKEEEGVVDNIVATIVKSKKEKIQGKRIKWWRRKREKRGIEQKRVAIYQIRRE